MRPYLHIPVLLALSCLLAGPLTHAQSSTVPPTAMTKPKAVSADAESVEVLRSYLSTLDLSGPLAASRLPIPGPSFTQLQCMSMPRGAKTTADPDCEGIPHGLITQHDLRHMQEQVMAQHHTLWDNAALGFAVDNAEGHDFSLPLFNQAHDLAIFRIAYHRGGASLWGQTVIMRKQGGRWTSDQSFGAWEQ